MRISWLAPLIMLGLSTPSVADPPRYARKQTFQIDVKPSKRVRPAAVVAPQVRPLTADEIIQLETDNQPIRLEQEALLVKLVRDTPDDDPEKPDHMFRLAELYAKQLRLWRLEANAPVAGHRAPPR